MPRLYAPTPPPPQTKQAPLYITHTPSRTCLFLIFNKNSFEVNPNAICDTLCDHLRENTVIIMPN